MSFFSVVGRPRLTNDVWMPSSLQRLRLAEPAYPVSPPIFFNIYRYLAAATGCITILLALRYLYQKLHFVITRALTTIGQASLCIYTINSLFNEFILVYLPFSHINYLITIAETITIIATSYGIYKLLKSNKTNSTIFLGSR